MLSLPFLSAFLTLAVANPIPADRTLDSRATAAKKPVSADEYANIVYYSQFPVSAQTACTDSLPSGIVQQQFFEINKTSTQAAIFRIDSRKEFVLAIPGTNGVQDLLTDANFILSTYQASGVNCNSCLAFTGFQIAWNSLSGAVEDGLRDALAEYPHYTVTISGHSLGGGLGELAFGSLRPQSFNVTALYTYGAPRVGNQQYADYIDRLSGADNKNPGIYRRVTHADDPFPRLPPAFLGYVHPRSEYWESSSTPSLGTTYQCDGQEPSDCIWTTIPAANYDAHTTYAGMEAFC